MRNCPNCQVSIRGKWQRCPLCQTALEKMENNKSSNVKSSFIDVPLQFNREKAIQAFFRISLFIVLLYLIAQYFWTFQFFGLEYVVFGLMITWANIVFFIRKRRNIAKAINYILFFVSIASLYLDYIDGWTGWSITFVIPILSISALIAMSISIRVVALRVGDYVLYLQLAAIVGLVPLLFLIMDWVAHPLPSILSVVFSFIMFVSVFIRYRKRLIHELQKRMHI